MSSNITARLIVPCWFLASARHPNVRMLPYMGKMWRWHKLFGTAWSFLLSFIRSISLFHGFAYSYSSFIPEHMLRLVSHSCLPYYATQEWLIFCCAWTPIVNMRSARGWFPFVTFLFFDPLHHVLHVQRLAQDATARASVRSWFIFSLQFAQRSLVPTMLCAVVR